MKKIKISRIRLKLFLEWVIAPSPILVPFVHSLDINTVIILVFVLPKLLLDIRSYMYMDLWEIFFFLHFPVNDIALYILVSNVLLSLNNTSCRPITYYLKGTLTF